MFFESNLAFKSSRGLDEFDRTAIPSRVPYDAAMPRASRRKPGAKSAAEAGRAPNGHFLPGGTSPNPSGRPKVVREIRELAQSYSAEAFAVLLEILRNTRGPTPSRVTAATEILNRAYGRPETSVAVKADISSIDELSDDLLRVIIAGAAVPPAPLIAPPIPPPVRPPIEATALPPPITSSPPAESTLPPPLLDGPDAATVRAEHDAAEAVALAEAVQRADAERLATETRTARAAVHQPGVVVRRAR